MRYFMYFAYCITRDETFIQLCNLWRTLLNNCCTTDLEYLVRIAEIHAKCSHNDRDNIHVCVLSLKEKQYM